MISVIAAVASVVGCCAAVVDVVVGAAVSIGVVAVVGLSCCQVVAAVAVAVVGGDVSFAAGCRCWLLLASV